MFRTEIERVPSRVIPAVAAIGMAAATAVSAGALEVVVPHFEPGIPVIFCGNVGDINRAWTPLRLEDELGITDLSTIVAVKLMVTPTNLTDVVCAQMAWGIEKIKAILAFKTFENCPEIPGPDACFGLEPEDIYYQTGDAWMARQAFRDKVRDLFKRNKRVLFA